MSYYSGTGDYYSGKGDPGFFSTLGNIIGGAGKIASAAIPGVGGIVRAGTSAIQKVMGGGSPTGLRLPTAPPSIPASRTPGVTGFVQRAVPGGASGYQCGAGCGTGYHLDKTTKTRCVRNRKTNYTNPRALSRAAKRMDGFVSVAKKALKSTNYKVVNKSYKQNYRKPLKR